MSYSDFTQCVAGYNKRLIEVDFLNWILGRYFYYAYGSARSKKVHYPKRAVLTPAKQTKERNYTLQELINDDNKFKEIMRKRGVKIK